MDTLLSQELSQEQGPRQAQGPAREVQHAAILCVDGRRVGRQRQRHAAKRFEAGVPPDGLHKARACGPVRRTLGEADRPQGRVLAQDSREEGRILRLHSLAVQGEAGGPVAKEGAHWKLDIQLDRLQVACGQEACNPSDALPSPAVRTREGGELQVPDGRVSREEVGGGLKGVPGVLHAELEPRGAAVAQGLQVDVHRSTAVRGAEERGGQLHEVRIRQPHPRGDLGRDRRPALPGVAAHPSLPHLFEADPPPPEILSERLLATLGESSGGSTLLARDDNDGPVRLQGRFQRVEGLLRAAVGGLARPVAVQEDERVAHLHDPLQARVVEDAAPCRDGLALRVGVAAVPCPELQRGLRERSVAVVSAGHVEPKPQARGVQEARRLSQGQLHLPVLLSHHPVGCFPHGHLSLSHRPRPLFDGLLQQSLHLHVPLDGEGVPARRLPGGSAGPAGSRVPGATLLDGSRPAGCRGGSAAQELGVRL